VPDVEPALVVGVDDPRVLIVAGLVEVAIPLRELVAALRVRKGFIDRLGRDITGCHREIRAAREDRIEEATRVAHHEPPGTGYRVGIVAVVRLDVDIAVRHRAGNTLCDPFKASDVVGQQLSRLAGA
jgi:hypothetical protein